MRLKLFRVTGNSMLPALKDKDYVLTRQSSDLQPGDIVVMNLPDYGQVIKRIDSLSTDSIKLSGDNPRLTSSCCERAQLKDCLIGKMIAKFSLPF